MHDFRSLDSLVRSQLKKWPQRPPGTPTGGRHPAAWLRGRPADCTRFCHPFLKLPGNNRMRTLPDGLWLKFGGTPDDHYCDIFAIEACSSLTNLLDKRSRFAPSTQSLLAVCPVAWLMAPVTADNPMPRWQATGILTHEPSMPLVLPVRDIKVVYGLKPRHYNGMVQATVPHPHEYFVPMAALTAEDGDKNPALQALVARASTTANFLTLPA